MDIKVVHIIRNAFDIYIGRPGPFGNPFHIGVHGTREDVINKFRKYIASHPEIIEQLIERVLKQGGRLGCYCSPLPCHGDIYKEILEKEKYVNP